METIEGNKIIAEFMGLPRAEKAFADRSFGYIVRAHQPVGNHHANELKYHTSFDWLMPVVEKITPLAKQMGQQAWFDVAHFFLSGNIEVVHQRVVDFIVWHNSTLLKQTT